VVLGASSGELALVGLLVVMVVLAPKVPRFGEWVASLLSPSRPGETAEGDDGEE